MVHTHAKLVRVLQVLTLMILLLVPFHAVFTTWLGANFGHLDAWRIWKEWILLGLIVGTGWLLLIDRPLRQHLRHDKLLIGLISLYVLLQLGYGVVALRLGRVNASALLFGWIIDLRLVAFLATSYVIAFKSKLSPLLIQKVLLWPAIIVIGFGLLQHFVLPVNFLSHAGYGPKTIPASQTIDQKSQYLRLQSTLRGANPLGAYLVLVLAALWVLATSYKRQRHLFGVAMLGGFIVLFFTYSRSAWIGMVLAIIVLAQGTFPSYRLRRGALVVAAALLIIGAGSLYGLRNSDLVQNTLFHTDEKSQSSQSSNAARLASIKTSVTSVVREPLGHGPGTAGPASLRNTTPPRIAENYYLQIAQEVGILGLSLFLAINVIIGWRLYRLRQQSLGLVLLAGFVGLTAVNMLLPAWTDDTLAYVFWGLTGLVLGSNAGILNTNKALKHEQNTY